MTRSIAWPCIAALTFAVCACNASPILSEVAERHDAVAAQGSPPGSSDSELLKRREAELLQGFKIAEPGPEVQLRPVERVPRDSFGEVGPPPLQLEDLSALIFPSSSAEDRAKLLEGMTFFTTAHTAEEGAGAAANQPFCLGCHESSLELTRFPALVSAISQVSRAGRSTPTNFNYTAFDPATGGGRAADSDDAVHGTGKTASFTLFGDYDPEHDVFQPLEDFGGFVQHTRPSLAACLPEPIPSLAEDPFLQGTPDAQGVYPSGFRRSVGERAAPPYIGRGLMEAIPDADIVALEDPDDAETPHSSLGLPAAYGCRGDCVSGKHNEIPPNPSFASGMGRFGLRANGAEILQFVIGGLQGELGLTSAINDKELQHPPINRDRPGCVDPVEGIEIPLSTPFSERNFLRNTAPPELGDSLLSVLRHADEDEPFDPGSHEGKVQRGAALFGVDVRAFANRMLPGRMPEGGDGLDPHAINQHDRMLDCVSCHTPVQRTGRSPADVGSEHLSYVWAPIFSDLLLHEVPFIEAERFAALPRDPWLVQRATSEQGTVAAFDVSRSLADDTFSNAKASAKGSEFRTPPLMALGRIGPPFLHDARVYLSDNTVEHTPASTVTSNARETNAPLVVRTLPDAIKAAIELHDLPAPDDAKTSPLAGGGCPVPGYGKIGAISYGEDPASAICPGYEDAAASGHRGEARVSTARFRALSPGDQEALIAFLQEL